MFGGETRGLEGGLRGLGSGSVWESWRVLLLLHAQSLLTLHQAAANTHTHKHRGQRG